MGAGLSGQKGAGQTRAGSLRGGVKKEPLGLQRAGLEGAIPVGLRLPGRQTLRLASWR